MSQMPTGTINLQLIDNLIQVIYSLPLAEQQVLKSKLIGPLSDNLKLENGTKESVIDILNESSGQQLFKTPEEVDRYLQQERESWDS